MAIYKYKAFNHKAQALSGMIHAESKMQAIEKVQSQSLVLTQISKHKLRVKKGALKEDTVIDFCKEMACLLRAKIPLFNCLKICQQRFKHLSNHTIFVHLVDGIKKGESLSSLMKEFPQTFDQVFVSCIQGAESSSRLDSSFQSLYEFMSFKRNMKKELLGICAYPFTLLGFGLIMTLFLLLGFVPQIVELFEGKSLHPITQAVIGLSQWLNHSLPLVGCSSLLMSFLVFLLVKFKKSCNSIKRFILKIPLVKTMSNGYNMARITRLFSLLLNEQITLLTTIRLVKGSYQGSLVYDSLQRVESRIMNGSSFSKALEGEVIFDKVFIEMMSIAQETGDLASMMRQAFDIYDLELKTSFQQFKKILQPALMFLLALIIGFILLATLLPLTDATNIL